MSNPDDKSEVRDGGMKHHTRPSEPWKMRVRVWAHRKDEEPDRLVRLGRLIGWLDAHDPEGLREHILSLGDRKGDLFVDWDAEPEDAARKLVDEGWEEENECVVWHSWPGGEPYANE